MTCSPACLPDYLSVRPWILGLVFGGNENANFLRLSHHAPWVPCVYRYIARDVLPGRCIFYFWYNLYLSYWLEVTGGTAGVPSSAGVSGFFLAMWTKKKDSLCRVDEMLVLWFSVPTVSWVPWRTPPELKSLELTEQLFSLTVNSQLKISHWLEQLLSDWSEQAHVLGTSDRQPDNDKWYKRGGKEVLSNSYLMTIIMMLN